MSTTYSETKQLQALSARTRMQTTDKTLANNILNLPEALDREKSDFDVFLADYFLTDRRGLISGIRKAVLLKKPLNGYHIVRLREFDIAVYVSQHFVDVYEQNRFTGYSFTPVQLT